jgi:hypothetical protein
VPAPVVLGAVVGGCSCICHPFLCVQHVNLWGGGDKWNCDFALSRRPVSVLVHLTYLTELPSCPFCAGCCTGPECWLWSDRKAPWCPAVVGCSSPVLVVLLAAAGLPSRPVCAGCELLPDDHQLGETHGAAGGSTTAAGSYSSGTLTFTYTGSRGVLSRTPAHMFNCNSRGL